MKEGHLFWCVPPPVFMPDANCTPVINITLQLSLGVGSLGSSGLVGTTALLAPYAGFFRLGLGFQLTVPAKAGGEAGVNHWAGNV